MPPERIGSHTRRFIGTERHFRWLEGVVYATLVLNLFDACFTLYWVLSRRATEANPLMATALEAHPIAFVSAKIALVSMGSWLLWNHRKRAGAVVAIFVAFLVYYALLLYHLSAFNVGLLRSLVGE